MVRQLAEDIGTGKVLVCPSKCEAVEHVAEEVNAHCISQFFLGGRGLGVAFSGG